MPRALTAEIHPNQPKGGPMKTVPAPTDTPECICTDSNLNAHADCPYCRPVEPAAVPCGCITAACGCPYVGDTSTVDHADDCREPARQLLAAIAATDLPIPIGISVAGGKSRYVVIQFSRNQSAAVDRWVAALAPNLHAEPTGEFGETNRPSWSDYGAYPVPLAGHQLRVWCPLDRPKDADR